MKKILFVFYLIVFSTMAYSETELEVLWNKAIAYSTDITSAEVSLKDSIKTYKNKRTLYPVNLKLSTESSFTDVYDEVTWFPSSAKTKLTVSKSNPYGNSISGGLTYGFGRGILNFLEAVDSKNIDYNHTPEANLSIEQSLCSAFFQGKLNNPEVLVLKRNISEKEYSKSALELSIIQSVTNLYVQKRNVMRQLEKYERSLLFYDEKIEAVQELYQKSQMSLSDVWSTENKKWNCYKEYIETMNTNNEIELSLKNTCGDSFYKITTEAVFPQSDAELFKYNPSKEIIAIKIENLTLQNLISKQNSAPKLSLEGSFSENTEMNEYFGVDYIKDKTNFNWSFSLGISFSEFFSPSRKMRQQQYEDNLLLYKERYEALEEQEKNKKENYSKLIESYQKQIERLSYVIENRKKLRNDTEVLFMSGKCSKLEFEEINLNVIEVECIYENLCDYLWLYQWQRTQCK